MKTEAFLHVETSDDGRNWQHLYGQSLGEPSNISPKLIYKAFRFEWPNLFDMALSAETLKDCSHWLMPTRLQFLYLIPLEKWDQLDDEDLPPVNLPRKGYLERTRILFFVSSDGVLANLAFFLIRLAAAALLIWALASHPYEYYIVLRWIICSVSAFCALRYHAVRATYWTWTFALLALLFNPIFPIHLSRELWKPINIVAALLILSSIHLLKSRERKESLPTVNKP